MAMLLLRPDWPWSCDVNRIETVNDMDGFIPNFWRAIQYDPDAVALHASWPVVELDLHARHKWLTNIGRQMVEQLRDDPDWFDAKIAGWVGMGYLPVDRLRMVQSPRMEATTSPGGRGDWCSSAQPATPPLGERGEG